MTDRKRTLPASSRPYLIPVLFQLIQRPRHMLLQVFLWLLRRLDGLQVADDFQLFTKHPVAHNSNKMTIL